MNAPTIAVGDVPDKLAAIREYAALDLFSREAGAQLVRDNAHWTPAYIEAHFEELINQRGYRPLLAAYGELVQREARRTFYGRKGGQS